jgi:phage terminase large subunit-like protein
VLEELHLLGRNPHATKVIRQIRGGLEKTPEGLAPDADDDAGRYPGRRLQGRTDQRAQDQERRLPRQGHRPLACRSLYEYPADIAKDKTKWQDPANWPMVMPNLGRSVHLNSLIADWETSARKTSRPSASGPRSISTSRWASAWRPTAGFGLSVLGREPAEVEIEIMVNSKPKTIKMKRWISWAHAWCHKQVLENRKSIAAKLTDFESAKELTIVDNPLISLAEIVAVIERVNDAGLLACVAIDPEGPYGQLVDALAEIGITEEGEQVIGVPQGYRLMNAIKTTEGLLSNRMLIHAKSGLMDWCVENVKIEPTATAIRATKQNAGDAKIDPWCALMDAATVMSRNPVPKQAAAYQMFFVA